jgi:Fic family protein
MDSEDLQPLSSDELTDIDARYVPFPSFSEWPDEISREDLWDRDSQDFHDVSALATRDQLDATREVAIRTAAFDSGAIEGLYRTDRGLTFTVATQALAWEQKVSEESDNALALFKGQLEAFELVVDFVAEKFPKMTQAWIRRLHEVVTSAQDTYVVHTPVGPQEQPLPKGVYKEHPNHVRTADGGIHAYAPVEQTQSEMQRLLDEIDTDRFRNSHPAVQAAYAHYALAVIHPFADGNGRVARTVASAFTYRAVSVPLLVLSHQRDAYLGSLAAADGGDHLQFLDFIGQAARDAMEMVIEGLRAAQAAQPEDILQAFRDMYVAQGSLSHRQLDELANRFVDDLLSIIQTQAQALSVPDGLDISWLGGSGGRQEPIPEGFRSLVTPGARSVQIDFSAAPPGRAQLHVELDVLVSTSSDPATSVMVRAKRTSDQLVFGQRDLSPELSPAAMVRLESFVRRILGESLKELLATSRASLRNQGY